MSKTIELPDPLFAEIDDYAARSATSPLVVLKLAWSEFAQRHAPAGNPGPVAKRSRDELLAASRALRGSISLPTDQEDRVLITEARMEKYGPL
jgi:hypothetical protein